jgi:hypothetical protein
MTAVTTLSMGKTMFAMHPPRPVGSMLHIADNNYLSTATPSVLPPYLSSLEDILKRIKRSNSWAYLKGIIPMYDQDGREIPNTKTPPWPWEILPEAIIKVGKKAWATEEIDAWVDRMKLRAACRVSNAHAGHGTLRKENDNG